MRILGLSCFYHDSAVALLEDGHPVCALQEERLSRKKHDPGFPSLAVQRCLSENNITLSDVDAVVFYEKPFLKFERLIETYLQFAPRGFKSFSTAMPIWVKEKLFHRRELKRAFQEIANDQYDPNKLLFSEHHLSHAASAFYPSPFETSVVLTMDGVGEWATTSVGVGNGSKLQIDKEIHFPHSLGMLYSAFTYYLGFRVNSGEYKVMGLAPYGQPRYADIIKSHLIDIKDDGSFRLNLKYFDYCTGLTMTNRHFSALFGQEVRQPETPLNDFHWDMAASVQAVTEEVMLALTRNLYDQYRIPNLCLAGGVALNCVANGKIQRDGRFKNIWIQPAAGDAGGALGAALAAHHLYFDSERNVSQQKPFDAYLGTHYSSAVVEKDLSRLGARYDVLSDEALYDTVADKLAAGSAVGWFQGGMEYGPRALGNRSILADPRSETMQKNLNLKIKFRESFRPFAPSVKRDRAADWFNLKDESPYMLLVADVHEEKRVRSKIEACEGLDKLNQRRSDIPAATHVDYSARVQTVDEQANARFYQLLSAFEAKTGCPVLVNTSFNIRGEPIVESPEDAYRCFMGTDLDFLVIGNCLLDKQQQDASKQKDYRDAFALD